MLGLALAVINVLDVVDLEPRTLGIATIDGRHGYVEDGLPLRGLAERTLLDLHRLSGTYDDRHERMAVVEGIATDFLHAAWNVYHAQRTTSVESIGIDVFDRVGDFNLGKRRTVLESL